MSAVRTENTQDRKPDSETYVKTASAVEHGDSGNAQLEQDIRRRSPSMGSTPVASLDLGSTTSEAQDRAFRSHVPEQSLRRFESKLDEMSREEVPAAPELGVE
jgi:hypothetical protein